MTINAEVKIVLREKVSGLVRVEDDVKHALLVFELLNIRVCDHRYLFAQQAF